MDFLSECLVTRAIDLRFIFITSIVKSPDN